MAHDLQLGRPEAPKRWPWVVGALLAVAAVVAGYLAFVTRTREETASVAAKPVAPSEPVRPLGGEASAVVLPPLDESDEVVAGLVKKLSSHPRVLAWLTTDGLVRNFAVVVLNVAEGNAPAAMVRPLRPPEAFRVLEQGGSLYIDSRSFARYTSLADAVGSIDAQGSAALYATVKPRLEDAHRELGELDQSFDRTLERAIVVLLQTPVPDGPLRVEPHGIGYAFADAKLEGLTAAQKQLLRMGPENARRIQTKLREIALALGIPEQRLPANRRP
jgi:hypothetical protein